jgi:IS30 family transposase
MKTTIVSTEAKARLQEAARNYAQPAPHKYRALEQVKESIAELRGKKASYKTITALLRDTAGMDVSHQTVARYCREVLEAKQSRRPAKKQASSPPDKSSPARPATKPTPAEQSSPVQPELDSPSPASPGTEASQTDTPSSPQSPYQRSRGPRIAHVRMADGRTT